VTHGSRPHLKTLEEIERDCIPGLVEVLREEGVEAIRYAMWDMTGWHRDYDPCIWRSRATEEQRRMGWEMWVRMEKILCTILREAHEKQIEETMDALEDEMKQGNLARLEECRTFLDERFGIHYEGVRAAFPGCLTATRPRLYPRTAKLSKMWAQAS